MEWGACLTSNPGLVISTTWSASIIKNNPEHSVNTQKYSSISINVPTSKQTLIIPNPLYYLYSPMTKSNKESYAVVKSVEFRVLLSGYDLVPSLISSMILS